jgi:hypothetical protein
MPGKRFLGEGVFQMTRITRCFALLVAIASISALPVQGQTTPPPRIFFTDLLSGPNTSGENNTGTILTIYGKNFGTTQGSSSVTIGGGAVASYLLWGGRSKAASPTAQLEMISVAIGSGTATGQVVVTTSAGSSTCENAQDNCQFTVRPGNIHCVATTGNDSNSGNFPSSCWATIAKAKNALLGGDIAYVKDGVSQTAMDNYNAALAIINNSCTASSPCALLAYPGATATIGTPSLTYGLRTPAVGGTKNNWVLAGFSIQGQTGMDLLNVDSWRVINNDFYCPQGGGQSACMHTDTTTNYFFYGNYTHNVGDQHGSIDKFYHGNYYTTNSNHIWAGWNEVNNNPTGSTTQGGCRAIQFFSTGGSNQFDLHIFNNYVHNAICDGLNFATVDPSKGTVEAYNNIVFHVGTGPDPANGSSNYTCISVGGGSSANVLAYNNTFYDCGGRRTSDSGAADPGPLLMANNIVYQLSGESYISPNSNASLLSGSNNLWYGLSSAPSQTGVNVTVNPLLANAGTDFTLQASSPAIGAGTGSRAAAADFAGNIRPAIPSIGAYEFSTTIAAQRPNPPTNLQVIVN